MKVKRTFSIDQEVLKEVEKLATLKNKKPSQIVNLILIEKLNIRFI